jgi:large subunit ribosomal protein L9
VTLMKVLLIQDVDNLGYAGDIKNVANGYGRNYLLPHNLAVLATPGAVKQAEVIRKAAEKQRAHEREGAQAISNQITGLELLFERRAGETGKLYGSVTSGDIAEAIQAKSGIELDKRRVALPEPIRSLGSQDVPIKLMIDVTTVVKVYVLPEGGIVEWERQRAAARAAEAAEQALAEEAPAEAETEA